MKRPKAIAALASLAQETRLEIFRLLVQKGPEGLPAGDIGERLGLPSPTLSFHLSHLKHAGLVKSRRHSRSIIYSADFATMTSLMAYLTENCCGGRSELCAPEACAPNRSAAPETGRKVR
jgi:ArsR family transcriptional regulator, arsenate/arsenite/antimonite-responsive transcriptional repressor